jgi:hypothetical protein
MQMRDFELNSRETIPSAFSRELQRDEVEV